MFTTWLGGFADTKKWKSSQIEVQLARGLC
jgi:hypothetical protein